MKKMSNLFILLAVLLFSFQPAFADGKGRKIEFGRNVLINGTEVKQGKYKVEFDEEKNEVSIWQGDKLIAKTTARKEAYTTKRRIGGNGIIIVKQNDKSLLKAIRFENPEEMIFIDPKNVDVSPQ